MPRGDRTGPTGMGPRTGRAAGYCGGYGMPGYGNYAGGYGRGRGFGRGGFGGGFGWRWRTAPGFPGAGVAPAYGAQYQQPDPEMEKTFLRNQMDALQAEMEGIRKRLADIDAGA